MIIPGHFCLFLNGQPMESGFGEREVTWPSLWGPGVLLGGRASLWVSSVPLLSPLGTQKEQEASATCIPHDVCHEQ